MKSHTENKKRNKPTKYDKTILVNIATLLTNKNELTFEDIFNESREPIKSHLEDLLFLLKRGVHIFASDL